MSVRSSVLLFLRPDVLLHVHDLWKNGRHDQRVTRGFAIPHVNERPPFVALGMRSIVEYLDGWRIDEEELRILRRMPSLQRLEPQFWDYLCELRFAGDLSAMSDGTVFAQRIEQSEEAQRMDSDDLLPLAYLTDVAAVVALTSNAIATMLDAQISYGRILFSYKLEKRPPTFWMSERIAHPRWAALAAEAEFILDGHGLFDQQNLVYLLWDAHQPFNERDHSFTDTATGEFRVHSAMVPLPPGGVSPAQLERKAGAEVRILIFRAVDLRVPTLGELRGRDL